MASNAGPARAAGRLAPTGTGRVILGPRKVRVETRTGQVRTKKGAPTPAVELELGADERLLAFFISAEGGPSLLASTQDRLAFEKRKTTTWDWEATVEVPVPQPRPASRRRRSTSNGRDS